MHCFSKFRELGVRAGTGRVPLLPLEKTILCRRTYGREEKRMTKTNAPTISKEIIVRSMRRITTIATAVLFALVSAQSFTMQLAEVPSSQEAIRVLKDENLYDSLTAAYQAAQYRVHHNGNLAVAGQSEWHASNPAQEMTTDFGADAVRLTVSESDGATRAVTLRLTGYGYEGSSQPPAHAGLTANDNRVE
jgi:hypothetical protein